MGANSTIMELLLHAGTKVLGWRTAEIRQAILTSFALAPNSYTLTQLRYDLRKLKAHGPLERDGRRYSYRLSDKGTRAALLFVLFHNASAAHSPAASSTATQPKPPPLGHKSKPPKSETLTRNSWQAEKPA